MILTRFTNKKEGSSLRPVFKSDEVEGAQILFARLRKSNQSGTDAWACELDGKVNHLFDKWDIHGEFTVHPDAYTGLVLMCTSSRYGDVVIKMYPPFLEKRYRKESFIIGSLDNYHQCRMLDVDDKCCAMLMERVYPGSYISYENDAEQIACMFSEMYEHRKAVDSVVKVEKELRGIVQQTKEELVAAVKFDYHTDLLCELVKKAENVYEETFGSGRKYIIHGDAYFKNALIGNDGIKIIDPVGYVDVFEFEYMPFLTYELALHTEKGKALERCKELIAFFKKFADVSRFLEAIFIFLVKQLVPSVYEANDGFQRADMFLELIRELYLDELDRIDIESHFVDV